MEDTGKSLKPDLKSTQWMYIAVNRIPNRSKSVDKMAQKWPSVTEK